MTEHCSEALEGDLEGGRAAMAVPVAGKVLLDTNVFVDYLRVGLHTELVT
jgi:hypothetical protein